MSELSLPALLMLVFGIIVCYGALAYFLYRAFKGKHR